LAFPVRGEGQLLYRPRRPLNGLRRGAQNGLRGHGSRCLQFASHHARRRGSRHGCGDGSRNPGSRDRGRGRYRCRPDHRIPDRPVCRCPRSCLSRKCGAGRPARRRTWKLAQRGDRGCASWAFGNDHDRWSRGGSTHAVPILGPRRRNRQRFHPPPEGGRPDDTSVRGVDHDGCRATPARSDKASSSTRTRIAARSRWSVRIEPRTST
jgi:hypothetical protein